MIFVSLSECLSRRCPSYNCGHDLASSSATVLVCSVYKPDEVGPCDYDIRKRVRGIAIQCICTIDLKRMTKPMDENLNTLIRISPHPRMYV